MSEPIIRVENLGKCYRIHHESRERYTALRDVISRKVKRLFSPAPASQSQGSSEEEFWALKDVSFEVNQGDVVGIIGRNGAGKSTLLKILSRITEPTKGRITLNGRIASLLEVGTGFHPELTGRENIYLNGAILGMTKAEIKSKFDEIVAFAEVERFLDTPVKRYSSGMYVRLAFAVAAHLEPEILVVDEVLAVGDAEFQKKCLGKMGEVAKCGRTVLFVSHQMAAVENLCSSGIVLKQGSISARGPMREVINQYISNTQHNLGFDLQSSSNRKGSGILQFRKVSFRDASTVPLGSLTCGGPVMVELHMHNTIGVPLRQVQIALGIDDHLGQRVTVLASNYAGDDFDASGSAEQNLVLHIKKLNLMPGRYSVTLFVSVNGEVADWIKQAGCFDVEGADFFGSGRMPGSGEAIFLMEHSFELRSSTFS
jgi:lipopolysaccharide transport system ATP-binding protein